ncbi:Hypothetical protein ADU72_0805 [Pediococcus damnosus]|uniref:Immunity protein n=1 Tax=Pediococcus damnosus TaxID=51663 RepID=A0A0R2HPY6_9LACO|nr:hypothetical protein [Pediococcus damnosus]AMV60758.1 Hypothetical protein ADU69_1097 [Pediococcus damnosus]AMV63349.1 Hypothetical protein ADU70_1883 [Pediococcus damnosus]AMV65070.1 Hypothetical protein ADU71_1172 [Pediococcus damnosus]AMV66750.1 Hypothetical protein ADU72_0805 [Pediococcus damnosus]AMV69885.1 Hypothetical protein ADU73_1493 [Pediococcus damnosus]
MLIERLVGVLVILGAVWQFYAFQKSFKEMKATANKNTNVLIGFALWMGLFFGIILLLGGLGLLFGAF